MLVHRSTVDVLRKVYWGGGSVVMALDDEPVTMFKMNPCSRFEDGTLNFLSIVALEHGLRSLSELGIDRVSAHVHSLTRYVLNYSSLKCLKNILVVVVVLPFRKIVFITSPWRTSGVTHIESNKERNG